LITDLNEEEALTLTSTTGINKSINLKKKYIKLPVVKPPFDFPDLMGWGV